MSNGSLIYITGLSGAGKTTIGLELQKTIPGSILLDGDIIRETINKDLGFTRENKIENIRRNNALIKMLYDQGFTIICCFMASIGEERDKLFDMCYNVIKIQLTTPVDICAQRDVKGLYAAGVNNFAGVTAKYCPLNNPDLSLDTSQLSIGECVDKILSL